MHVLHHRKASVTGPPTGSNSAGRIFGSPGVPQSRQREAGLYNGATMQSRVRLQIKPPRREAARATHVQLQAVACDVADGLERKRAEHGAKLNAAASQESLSQQ